ncbi:MAG: AAA family ATPase [Planctomycetia bacterium]|nr:AAA family ATPase [Planctomycetia bacterium]
MSNEPQPTPAVFAHGSTWVRADFHMHTKADKEFRYDGQANDFVQAYVAALKQAAIHVGVITNHNKFDRDEFKSLSKAAKKEEIFLLPGVELSVKDGANGIHTLVVFAPEWITNQENKNYIQNFLDVTFAGKANYDNENGRSNHDLNETIRELNKFEKDYFLIFAHVEDRSGLWKELDGGRRTELAKFEPFKERCLGFQKVRTHDDRKIVQEQMKDSYPVEVEGCDCKAIGEIGKGEQKTYIKIGAFNFEAVKFALIDHAHRVKPQPVVQPHSFITAVKFEGAKLDDTTLQFSPELNSFIGIRGSGKSSIIESIRYALGIELPANADRDGYKEGSVKHALGSGGKVTLFARDRHGAEYEVRRILGEQPDVYVGGTIQPGISIRETVIHKPMYFGQKDLSSTGQGFENDLVEKLVGESLVDVRQAITLRKQAVIETVRRLQKLNDVAEREKEFQAKKLDAEHRLKVFKEHGVEEKLQKQVDFDQDSRITTSLNEFVDEYLQSLDDFIAQYADEFATRGKYESKRNPKFFAEFLPIFGQIAKGFAEIQKLAEVAKNSSLQLKSKAKEFDGLKSALKEEFAEVARKLSEELKSSGATAIEPDEFLKLRKTIENAKQILAAIAKEKDQQSTLQSQLSSDLANLNSQWHEEFRLIKERLDQINEQETALQIDIGYKDDKAAFLKFVKDLFKGSKLRETTLESLTNEFADGAAIYRELDKAKKLVGNSADTFELYFRDNLVALLTWQVPNKFTIKYHGKQLKNHSLGQRASALILFVLSQRDNDIVIIDQPEDDLDNQTIYEDVIKLVRKLKPNTQFIFATHNPNIPVLGDSEQVIACAFDDEHILTDVGSIDCPQLQEAIVRIMEGGSEAFRLRKEIYQVWKHRNY